MQVGGLHRVPCSLRHDRSLLPRLLLPLPNERTQLRACQTHEICTTNPRIVPNSIGPAPSPGNLGSHPSGVLQVHGTPNATATTPVSQPLKKLSKSETQVEQVPQRSA